MDERNAAATALGDLPYKSGPILPKPFDPAVYLDKRRTVAVDAVTAESIAPVETFDPAVNLGASAMRGPMNVGMVKPASAIVGGVEVVTIPAEHYAALLSPLSLARPGVIAGGGTPDPDGMFLLLLSLHADGVVSVGQLAQAMALDPLDLGDRIAAYAAAQPKPWKVDGMENGTITGLTDDGQRFYATPVADEPSPAVVAEDPAPVDFLSTPEEARIALPPDPAEVPITAEEQATAYDAAVARGDVVGNAIDAKGNPAEAGKGEAASDAERGGTSRRRSRR